MVCIRHLVFAAAAGQLKKGPVAGGLLISTPAICDSYRQFDEYEYVTSVAMGSGRGLGVHGFAGAQDSDENRCHASEQDGRHEHRDRQLDQRHSGVSRWCAPAAPQDGIQLPDHETTVSVVEPVVALADSVIVEETTAGTLAVFVAGTETVQVPYGNRIFVPLAPVTV